MSNINKRWYKMLLGTFMVLLALLTFCTKDESAKDPIETLGNWTYSGTVVNAQTGKVFGDKEVTISYINEANVACTTFTNLNGQFSVPNNPTGSRAFTFYRVGFTTMRRTPGSTPDSTGVAPDVAQDVTLYPLTGSITGKVVGVRHSAAAPKNLGNVEIVAKYDTTGVLGQFDDMKGAFYLPVKATSVAGTGIFTLVGLPVARGAYLEISQVTDSGIIYEYTGITTGLPKNTIPVEGITDGKIVSVNDLVVRPVNAGAFVFVSDNLAGIKPNSTLSLAYATAPDGQFSKFVLTNAKGEVIPTTLTVDVTLKTINIKPGLPLTSGAVYTLSGQAYGLAGGEAVYAAKAFTVQNGGLEFVDSSNVFSNGQVVNGIGVKEPIYFKFSKAIQKMNATVDNGVTQVTVSAVGNLLTVTPVQQWGATVTITVNGTLSAGFFRSNDVNFTLTLSTGSGLKIITDNFQNGTLPFNGALSVTANVPLNGASCVINPGNILTTPAVVGQVATFKPAINLVPGNAYTATIVLEATDGQKFITNPPLAFTVLASSFFPQTSNLWNNNNSVDPVQNFKIRENIVYTYSEAVTKVDVVLKEKTTGKAVLVAATANGVTVTIDPAVELLWDEKYLLDIVVVNAANVKHVITAFEFKTEVNPFFAVSSNVRYDNMWNKPMEDFPSNAAMVITMSKPIKKATVKLARHWWPTATTFNSVEVQTRETINENVLTIKPEIELLEDNTYYLIVHMEDFDGYIFSSPIVGTSTATFAVPYDRYFVFGLSPDQTSHVKSSNVLTADLVPETQVPVNQEIWFELYNTPDNVTYPLQVDLQDKVGGVVYDKTIRISGDTIFIKPTKYFTYKADIQVYIKGRFADGTHFVVDYLNATALWDYCFTAEREIYVTETNTDLADGDPVETFTAYAPMTFVFSEPLDTNLSKIKWRPYSGAELPVTKSLNGDFNAGTVNCTYTLSADQKTLTVTPIVNLIHIVQDDVVGFDMLVKGVDYKTSEWIPVCVRITPVNLQVVTSNTKKTSGEYRDDFGLIENVTFTLNHDVASIKQIRILNPTLGSPDEATLLAMGITAADIAKYANIPDVTLDQVTITGGKNVVFQTKVKFAVEKTYAGEFTFKYPDGTTDEVVLAWKTVRGIRILATNNRDGSAFRAFRVIGDSLVVEFSKPVITSTFFVQGFSSTNMARYTIAWNAERKIVTLKNLDTLNASPYDETPYQQFDGALVPSTGLAEVSGNSSCQYASVVFGMRCDDGDARGYDGQAVLEPALEKLEVHTEQKVWVINANFFDFVTNVPVSGTNAQAKDTVALQPTLIINFNRNVDTAMVNANAWQIYRDYIILTRSAEVSLVPEPIQFNLTWLDGGNSVQVNPIAQLLKNTDYDFVLKNLRGPGVKFADGFNTVSIAAPSYPMPSILNQDDFRTIGDPIVDIKHLTCVMGTDTTWHDPDNNSIYDTRHGYTANWYGGTTAHATNRVFYLKFNEAAWHANHNDSVTHYEIRFRNTDARFGTGVWNHVGNRTGTGLVTSKSYNNNDPVVNVGKDLWQHHPVNIQPEVWFDEQHILSWDGDNRTEALPRPENPALDFFKNHEELWNKYNVEIQMRPVHWNTAETPLFPNLKDHSFGTWSNVILISDDIAPGDSTFGQTNVYVYEDDSLRNGYLDALSNPVDGGVHALPAAPARFTRIEWNRFDYGGYDTAAIMVQFPEDMDQTTKPSLLFYNPLRDNTPAPTILGNDYTKYYEADQYRFAIQLAPNRDYVNTTVYAEYFERGTSTVTLSTNASAANCVLTDTVWLYRDPAGATKRDTVIGGTTCLGLDLNATTKYYFEANGLDYTAAAYDVLGATPNGGQYIAELPAFTFPTSSQLNGQEANLKIEFMFACSLGTTTGGDFVDLDLDIDNNDSYDLCVWSTRTSVFPVNAAHTNTKRDVFVNVGAGEADYTHHGDPTDPNNAKLPANNENGSNWKKVVIDVPAATWTAIDGAVGRLVQFRFRVRTDNNTNGHTHNAMGGVYIDNFRITYYDDADNDNTDRNASLTGKTFGNDVDGDGDDVPYNSWYYRVNVVGIKDYNGVTLQNSGRLGNLVADPTSISVLRYGDLLNIVNGNIICAGPVAGKPTLMQ